MRTINISKKEWLNDTREQFKNENYRLSILAADQYLNLASPDDPNISMLHNRRGLANYRLGNYSEAIEDCTRAIARNPQKAIFYFNRGRAHAALGLYMLAQEDFANTLRLDSDFPEAERWCKKMYKLASRRILIP